MKNELDRCDVGALSVLMWSSSLFSILLVALTIFRVSNFHISNTHTESAGHRGYFGNKKNGLKENMNFILIFNFNILSYHRELF